MSWKQTSNPNDIGYMKNASGTPILEWHERAPERKLIVSGTFSDNYPFIATSNHPDQPMTVRCPESKKAVPLSVFEEKQLCRNCQHRKGNEPIYPTVQVSMYPTSIDLAGIICENKYYSRSDMLVPQGCPCAGSESSMQPHRKVARTYHLGRESELVPKAWKLTFDGERFRLSFHFRRIFISKNGKFANDGFFQHIVVDINSGKTFITAVGDGTRRSGEKKPRLVDDITYTGNASYLSSNLLRENLRVPLEALYRNVVSELAARNLTSSCDDEPIGDVVEKTISEIARVNRFPGIGENPFPDRWMLPDRMQRKVTSSPRRASVEQLMQHIGLDPKDEELKKSIAAAPSSLENIYVLREVGCDDRKAWLVACSTSSSDNIRFFLKKFIAGCTRCGFDGVDVLDLMLPKTGAFDDWKKCVGEMADIGSEASRRSSAWMETFTQNAALAALYLNFPISDGLRDMVAKLNTESPYRDDGNLGICKDQDLKDRFQSSKVKWHAGIVSREAAIDKVDSEEYMSWRTRAAYERVGSGDTVIVSFSANSESFSVIDIELHRKASLDRRKWRGQVKSNYRSGVISGREVPSDVVTATYDYGEMLSSVCDISMKSVVSSDAYEKMIRKWCKKHFVKLPKNFSVNSIW